MKNYLKKAFSLIELSIVILIIGILVAGVTQSSRLINQMKISTAKNLTRSSGVENRNLMFWWETTLDESFISGEASDGNEITQWNDINPLNLDKLNGYRGQRTNGSAFNYDPSGNPITKGPNYISNGINNLPTLRFPGTASQSIYLQTDTKFKVNNSRDLLLFIVVRYYGGSGWLIDRVCQNFSGYAVTCGVSSTLVGQPLFNVGMNGGALSGLIRGNNGSQFLELNSPNNSFMINKTPMIITLERKFKKFFTIYVNGKQLLQAVDSVGIVADIDMVKLGRHSENTSDNLNFDVSEFIYFNGTVNDEERDSIENYLGKKFNIKVSN